MPKIQLLNLHLDVNLTFTLVIDIDTDVSISDITDYLSGVGIKVVKVYCLSSVSAHTKSFKLTVSSDDYDKVFNPDLWEEGTRVREWGAHGRPLH